MRDDVSRVAELAGLLGDEAAAALAEELLDQLPSGELNLLIVGQFKRGKSTLVNALLGADVMPTGALPVTGVVTAIRYGPEPLVEVQIHGKDAQTIAPADLVLYVSEQYNPGNALGVERVSVWWPSECLRGLVVLDTPGVGSTYEHNTSTAEAALPRADAAILVVGPEPPVGATELQYARATLDASEKLFVVLNKRDLAGDALPDVLEFTRNALARVFGPAYPLQVVPLSATRAREQQRVGKDDLEFKSFVSSLRNLVDEQGERTRHRSARRRAAGIVRRLEVLLAMRAEVLNLPFAERQRRRALVERTLQSLDDRIRGLTLIVDDDVKRLIAELHTGLDRRYDDERAATRTLSQTLSKQRSSSDRDEMLQRIIQERTEVWRVEAVENAGVQLRVNSSKYTRLVADLERAALQAGCEVLQVDPGPLDANRLEFSSAKLQLIASLEPTTGLELLTSFAIDLLPAPLREPILRRRFEYVVDRELDALRGKLRFGISRDLDRWRRAAETTIVEAIDGTRQSVLNAFRELSTEEEETHQAELAGLTTMRDELRTMLDRFESNRVAS